MKIINLTLLIFLLAGCQSLVPPLQLNNHLQTQIITERFHHLVIHKPASDQSRRLHVYIEGDGLPFRNRFEIAKDPSPRYPLTLNLMMLDPNESINLGRPCYFSTTIKKIKDADCSSTQWTSSRYSAEIVADMVSALRDYLREHPSQKITLIGYSGGGTLAMLMAARMPEVDQLVTLAGNLNTRAWTDFHHYTPMKNSVNPADDVKIAQPKHQIHFTGDKDSNIPAALGQDFLRAMEQHYTFIKDADHQCCWEEHWREMLIPINQQIEN